MGYLLRQVLDLGLRPRWSGTALSGTGQLFDDSRVIPNANRLLCLHVGERRSILRDLLLDDSMLKMETQREVRALKISRRQRFGSRSFCSSLLLVPIRFESWLVMNQR